jgi:DNA-binding NarL/FixJ family response regulator
MNKPPLHVPGGLYPTGNYAALSRRESEIVSLVVQGFRNRDIAEKLFISEQTVKNHVHNIFGKMGVRDRLELALCSIHQGLPAPRSPVAISLDELERQNRVVPEI